MQLGLISMKTFNRAINFFNRTAALILAKVMGRELKKSGTSTFSRKYYCVNLQATKLFIVTSATKGGGYHPLRFSGRLKILYRVIQRLIQHCLLRKMVYLNII